MTGCDERSKITCEIRCMDPGAVDEAARRLDPSGVEWVSYTCQLSGEKEAILLVGDDLAARLTNLLPEVEDVESTKIVAGLHSSELCECDVATLTGLSEDEVISHLTRLTARGVLAHRKVRGMNYFRLNSDIVRQRLSEAIEGLV